MYSTIRSFVTCFKKINSYQSKRDYSIECEYPSEDESSALIKSLEHVYSPFCISGKLSSSFDDCHLVGASTFSKINVAELLEMAAVSPFGRGTETVVDPKVRNSFEVDMKNLCYSVRYKLQSEIPLEKLSPGNYLSLRPYKLVLYQEGGHFDAHRDTVRGEDHIGTLVVILNSEYTGGELEVTHHGHTESVTGPYSWVAMYGDCLHQIKPVTSGTRVSLIFDIHKGYDNFWNASRRDEEKVEVREGLVAVPSEVKSEICAALEGEIDSYDPLVICLSHMYPACQTEPSFLKGADRLLYDLLQERFEVKVVYCSIYRVYDEEDGEDMASFQGFLFDSFNKSAIEHGGNACEPKNKKQKLANDAPAPKKTKFVIPRQLDPDSILDYTPYVEHTGNESQAEETMYVVTGLQVRRRSE